MYMSSADLLPLLLLDHGFLATMQASSSRAGLAILNSSLAASKTLPPCTCGALKSVRQMTSKSTAGSYNQSIQSPAPQVEARASLPYRGRSQAEKLATREQRTTVFLKGLRPRTTPNDVRRLVVQRAGHGGGVKEGTSSERILQQSGHR